MACMARCAGQPATVIHSGNDENSVFLSCALLLLSALPCVLHEFVKCIKCPTEYYSVPGIFPSPVWRIRDISSNSVHIGSLHLLF